MTGNREKPILSIIVVVFNMPREAPRTLFTLTADYQRVSPDQYEVIVVDNGSTPPLGHDTVRAVSERFTYVYLEPGRPSPAAALNEGARRARGPVLGLMIDGARMLSPGLVQYALRATRSYRNPVIGTLGFHLGPAQQSVSVQAGYNQAVEDQLLDSTDWRADGYRLFEIASFAGSSQYGWFAPIAESNCVFVTRGTFEALGGFDEAFDLPGGGLVNLDFYRRACEHPGAELVVLLGEGTFHQYHGGAMTGKSTEVAEAAWRELAAQYSRLRGIPYAKPVKRCDYLGHAPPSVVPSLRESLDFLDHLRQNDLERHRYAVGPSPPNPLPSEHRPQRTIVMLGMHRSGTSTLAGSLEEAGLALGPVTTRSPNNPKGNRENRAILFMQEDLLQRNGGSWDNPPETVRWGPLHQEVRDLFIQYFRDEPVWGFKDPRTLLTLDGWLEVLPGAERMGIFRHPARVATSLHRRDGSSIEKGLRLWQVYNRRLLRLHTEHAFPLIEFEEDPDRFRGNLQRLIRLLDLPYAHRALTFFEEALRGPASLPMSMPIEIQRLYDELKERAL